MKKYNNLRFIFPILVLIIIFISLNVVLFQTKLVKYNSLEHLNTKIFLASKISKLIHEIQLERGLSVAYFVSQSDKYKLELKKQRIITNVRYKELLKYLQINDFAKELKRLNIIINNNVLVNIRKKIIYYIYNDIDIINYYARINEKLLNIIISSSKISEEITISKDINAYIFFLFSKEYAGLERAAGVNIFSEAEDKQHLNKQLRIIKFTNLISKQEMTDKFFFQYANKEFKELYISSSNLDSFINVKFLREKILNTINVNNFPYEINFWFSQMSLKIDELKVIDDKISSMILEKIRNKKSEIKKELILFLVLDIFVSLITIFMLFLLLNVFKREKGLRLVIDKNVIYSTTDLKGKIIDASEAFCNISGYSKKELIGFSHNKLRHNDMSDLVFKKMWKAILNGEVWVGEVKNKRKDNSFYWVNAIITPVISYGKTIGFTSTREDITYKKELELVNKNLKAKIYSEVSKNREKDQLLSQQARLIQMGEMISMIAHQWRQPLSAISSLSLSLILKSKLNTLNKEHTLDIANKISANSKHLSETIDDFRDFFKTTKEKKEDSFEFIIEKVLNIIEASLERKDIKIIKDFSCFISFLSYPNEIKQVVLNLIKNSEDALIENKIKNAYIKIITYKKDNNIILEVSDNAKGIDKKIISKIFDPYYSTKTKKDGTGLGLYMSKTIIENHCKGKLTVQNLNEGAAFRIIFDINKLK